MIISEINTIYTIEEITTDLIIDEYNNILNIDEVNDNVVILYEGQLLSQTFVAQHIETSFDFTDTEQKKLIGEIPANVEISRCVLCITEVFDGGATITIGDDNAQGRLMMASENNPIVVANYYRQPDYSYPIPTQINIYLHGEPTKGQGKVIIYYS